MMITTPNLALPSSPERALPRSNDAVSASADDPVATGESDFARQLSSLQHPARPQAEDYGKSDSKQALKSGPAPNKAGAPALMSNECGVDSGGALVGIDSAGGQADGDPTDTALPTLQIPATPPDMAAVLAAMTIAVARQPASTRTEASTASDGIDQRHAPTSAHTSRLMPGEAGVVLPQTPEVITGHAPHSAAGLGQGPAAPADTLPAAVVVGVGAPVPTVTDPLTAPMAAAIRDQDATGEASASSAAIVVSAATGHNDVEAVKVSHAPVERHVEPDIHSPQFGSALGTQITLLTREGVQQARLSLHPAEMGPISVRITLDGQEARIDFHAEIAATRSAIESSLPALAGALRDAGFTLAGGGVFQHHSGGRQHTGDKAPVRAARTTALADPDSAAGAVGLTARSSMNVRGLVDLYA